MPCLLNNVAISFIFALIYINVIDEVPPFAHVDKNKEVDVIFIKFIQIILTDLIVERLARDTAFIKQTLTSKDKSALGVFIQ